MFKRKRRIGILGFGSLGQYLVSNILANENLELAFVWNRNIHILRQSLDNVHILESLDDMAQRKPDLVVEVAHPDITIQYGASILKIADYMVGSPTALCNQSLEYDLRLAASNNGLYIPSGALWGAEDIRKMADRGSLQQLTVTMTFHPDSLKLVGKLKGDNAAVTERTVLYQGAVRELCLMAPNNVNTMAAASIAAHNLGFDGTQGCLISDPSLKEWHIIEIDVIGSPSINNGLSLHVNTVRRNPAQSGQVTGAATFASFFSSLLRAKDRGSGIHLC